MSATSAKPIGAIGAAHAKSRAVRDTMSSAAHSSASAAKRRALATTLSAGAVDRRAGDRGGTRTPGAVAERNPVGVALDHTGCRRSEAEPVGGDLRRT